MSTTFELHIEDDCLNEKIIKYLTHWGNPFSIISYTATWHVQTDHVPPFSMADDRDNYLVSAEQRGEGGEGDCPYNGE